MNKEPEILLVDDDKFIRLHIVKLLEKYQLKIIQAEDGDQALDIIEENKPDLVLLDLVMPGLNGEDVLVEVRNLHSAEELPVVVVTADKGQMTIYKLKLLGAQSYITKPFSESSIVEIIESVLDTKLKKVDEGIDTKVANKLTSLQKREDTFDEMFMNLVANMLAVYHLNHERFPVHKLLQGVTNFKEPLSKIFRVNKCKLHLMQKLTTNPNATEKEVLKMYVSLAYEETKRIGRHPEVLDKIWEIITKE